MTSMYKSVESLYNNPKLKIGSCMANHGFDLSIYNKLDILALAISDNNDNTIARTLIHDGKCFDRVYATSYTLELEVEKHILRMGYTHIPVEYSVTINHKEFVPYMDTLKYITKKGDKLTFGLVSRVATHIADRTDGGMSKI